MMKKNILAIILMMAVIPAIAQTDNTTTGRQQRTQAVNDALEVAGQFGNRVGDFLGVDDRLENTDDLVKIRGVWYSPIYDVNLYGGADAAQFISVCRQMFAQRYPQAVIQSAVIPQTDWVQEDVVKNKVTVGYTQELYCFIVARDGSDGYINAKFSFKRYKDVGSSYVQLTENWPRWERTDYLSQKVYLKLIK